jgi:hypothetical protein
MSTANLSAGVTLKGLSGQNYNLKLYWKSLVGTIYFNSLFKHRPGAFNYGLAVLWEIFHKDGTYRVGSRTFLFAMAK